MLKSEFCNHLLITMNTHNILGYVLLAIGLLLIGLALFKSYQIFTGGTQAPVLFKAQMSGQPLKTDTANNPQDLQKQINQEIAKQISQMIPADTLPKVLKLASWSMLAGILIFGGAKIAGLGITLTKQV